MSDTHIRAFNLGQLLTCRHPRAAFAKPAYIAGTVQVEGQPVRRRVRCIERQTGRFIAETWSAADGRYRFDDLYPGRAYQIIAMDYGLEYNAVIADNVKPVLGGVEWPTLPEEELLAPVGLEARYDSDTGINTLTWRNVNHTQETVRVYRSTSPIGPENLPAPLAELGGFVDSFDDDTVVEDMTYYYRLAVVRDGVGVVSTELESKPGTAPDFTNAQVGDEIAGGIYAGVHLVDGTDYHIVAAKADGEGYGLEWKLERTPTSNTGSYTDGVANTLAMESDGLSDHPAAEHCLAYSGGGYSDWYMPARDELTLLYNNLSSHVDFADNVGSGDFTWSSTEASSGNAWNQRFSNDSAINYSHSKDNTSRRVRPIRRVPV